MLACTIPFNLSFCECLSIPDHEIMHHGDQINSHQNEKLKNYIIKKEETAN